MGRRRYPWAAILAAPIALGAWASPVGHVRDEMSTRIGHLSSPVQSKIDGIAQPASDAVPQIGAGSDAYQQSRVGQLNTKVQQGVYERTLAPLDK